MVVQYQRKMIPIHFNVARDNNEITVRLLFSFLMFALQHKYLMVKL